MRILGREDFIEQFWSMVEGAVLTGKVDKALSCFTKMMEKNFDADVDLLEVLVNGLCGQNKAGGAYTLFVEMVEKARLRPWQATFKHLIQKLLGEGKLEESMKLLHLTKRHNFPPKLEIHVLMLKISATNLTGKFDIGLEQEDIIPLFIISNNKQQVNKPYMW
ncbi:pentatricopeptide repeat-containing protein At3g48250, chloroplastic-like [Magnolia sinica]|uniref:pentatricopeptide repeat-containing protein At3g48250, chloroplastic-like n=1 Tax=Magnolia sinica TaxID=86752 RepID=UPI002658C2D1|nr:pentatricopeptide repeat-containing protein At3g48250, chloroplastic-like [Magnolia sinica]